MRNTIMYTRNQTKLPKLPSKLAVCFKLHHFHRYTDGTWNDGPCMYGEYHGFIVEYPDSK